MDFMFASIDQAPLTHQRGLPEGKNHWGNSNAREDVPKYVQLFQLFNIEGVVVQLFQQMGFNEQNWIQPNFTKTFKNFP